MSKQKVLIIGGGFGGINAAKILKKADVDLLLIDRSNHHLFQPLLYQVATAALSPGNIAAPLRDILANQSNTTVLLADIVSINLQKKEAKAENGEIFKYDFLILAPGTTHSYFGHSEWENYAPGLKTLNDALEIRRRILLSYERAERCKNPSEAEKFMCFVIVGGGPTGVEMAGAIAEIAQKTLVKNFRHIKPEQTKIYLVEGTDRILPSFPPELSQKALDSLNQLGVEVVLKTFVTDVTSEGAWLGNRFIATPNIIWAAGNEASPLIKTLGTPIDKYGRAIVNPDLSLPDHPDAFVIGDAACAYDKKGKILSGTAPVAIQQGRYVAKLIKDNVPIHKRKPFKYFDKGMMATIGKAKAVAVMGKIQISGLLAWLAWCFIHVAYLISFPSKLLVMIEWIYLYLGNERRIRLITRPVSDEDDPL